MAITITKSLIHSVATLRGGWTREQLEILGVPWPPASGWMDRIIGKKHITAADLSKLTELSDKSKVGFK